jgi:hypothetical protein
VQDLAFDDSLLARSQFFAISGLQITIQSLVVLIAKNVHWSGRPMTHRVIRSPDIAGERKTRLAFDGL